MTTKIRLDLIIEGDLTEEKARNLVKFLIDNNQSQSHHLAYHIFEIAYEDELSKPE
jgi:polyhydroxyalkanoate synthesis regulator phasin